MRVSFCRYRLLGAGMHHIIIALSAVAAVALTDILLEFRRRSRAIGDRGDAACPSPSKQNGRTLRGATPIQPTRNLVVRHSEDGSCSRGEAA
jgi:hypothetical protein